MLHLLLAPLTLLVGLLLRGFLGLLFQFLHHAAILSLGAAAFLATAAFVRARYSALRADAPVAFPLVLGAVAAAHVLHELLARSADGFHLRQVRRRQLRFDDVGLHHLLHVSAHSSHQRFESLKHFGVSLLLRVDRLVQLEHRLARLEELRAKLPDAIIKVQGTGLLFSCELSPDYLVVGDKSIEVWLRENGLGVIHGGENSLRFTPVFDVTSEQLELLVSLVERALQDGPRAN